MSDPVMRSRTNYFRVKDIDALRADLARYGITAVGWQHRPESQRHFVLDDGVDNKPEGAIALFCFDDWPSFEEDAIANQHSWVVLGENCYDPRAEILDPTLWSYDNARSPLLLLTDMTRQTHQPHGSGSIFSAGMPSSRGGEPIELDQNALGADARRFLALLEPLDVQGWMQLVHSPVQGWPAGEIIAAAYADQRLRALVPIDILGMTTDLNPKGLYR